MNKCPECGNYSRDYQPTEPIDPPPEVPQPDAEPFQFQEYDPTIDLQPGDHVQLMFDKPNASPPMKAGEKFIVSDSDHNGLISLFGRFGQTSLAAHFRLIHRPATLDRQRVVEAFKTEIADWSPVHFPIVDAIASRLGITREELEKP